MSEDIIDFYRKANNEKVSDILANVEEPVLNPIEENRQVIEVEDTSLNSFLSILSNSIQKEKEKRSTIQIEESIAEVPLESPLKESTDKQTPIVSNTNIIEEGDPLDSFLDKFQNIVKANKEKKVKATTLEFINNLKNSVTKIEEERKEEPIQTIDKEKEEEVLPNPITPIGKEIVEQEPLEEKPVITKPGKKYIGELKALDQKVKKVEKPVTKPNDIKALIAQQVEAQTAKVTDEVKAYARRIFDLGGGGGSVAQQFANGGTMNGNLNVTGQYLSGGIDLATIFSTGSGGGGQTDRLISGNESLILNSDGTVSLPNNTLSSPNDIELILESENTTLSAFTQVALTPHGFFAYDSSGNTITFDSVSDNITLKTVNNYTWVFDDEGNITGPSGILTVAGNINATGSILSGGIDLSNIFLTQETDSQTLTYTPSTYQLSISNGNTVSLASLSSIPTDLSFLSVSGNWNSTYTTVSNNSGDWNTAYNNSTAYQNVSGLFITAVSGATNQINVSRADSTVTLSLPDGAVFPGNVTVLGNISAQGTATFANTIFTTTSALCAVANSSGPALYVSQLGSGDLASFYDFEPTPIEVLHVGASIGTPGVGIYTSFPNKELTVVGEISATKTIYASGGNSDVWNNTYDTVSSLSADWNTAYQAVATIPYIVDRSLSAIDTTVGSNTASGIFSSVLGGICNTASGAYSIINGGIGNYNPLRDSIIGGGVANHTGGFAPFNITAAASISGNGTQTRLAGTGIQSCFTSPFVANNVSVYYSNAINPLSAGCFATATIVATGTNFVIINGDYSSCTPSGLSATNIFIYDRSIGTTTDYGNVIGGGKLNTASADYSFIGGGFCNRVLNGSYSSVVGGFNNNNCSVGFGVIAGGANNTITNFANYSSIAGGRGSTVSNWYSSIGGGTFNSIQGQNSAIAGGSSNSALNNGVAIAGGCGNTAAGFISNIDGGFCNIITSPGQYSAIGSGKFNYNPSFNSNIAGGSYNHTGGFTPVNITNVANISGNASGTCTALIATGIGSCFSASNTTGAVGIIWNTALTGPSLSAACFGTANVVTNAANCIIINGNYSSCTATGLSATSIYVYDRCLNITGRSNFIGGGILNTASGCYDTIAGGQCNTTNNTCGSFVGGGVGNCIVASVNGCQNSIVGGCQNLICGNTRQATILGGQGNVVSVQFGTASGYRNCVLAQGGVAIGASNRACGNFSVSLGQGNTSCGSRSTVSGAYNLVSGSESTVAGGCRGSLIGNQSFIGSGVCNNISSSCSVIVGGAFNNLAGCFTFVGSGSANNAGVGSNFSAVIGGCGNCLSIGGSGNFIGGGFSNTANNSCSVVVGGCCNTAGGLDFVGGGLCNTASANYSAVVAGAKNVANANFSFIAGGQCNSANEFQNTFILGSSLSASKANYTYVNNLSVQGNIESNTNYTATAYLSANINLPQNNDLWLPLTKKNDPNNWITTGTSGVITPTIQGYYYIAFQAAVTSATGSNNQNNIQIRLNGTNTKSLAQMPLYTGTGASQTMHANAILYLNGTTDSVNFSVYSGGTSQQAVGTTDGNWTKVEIFKIN